MTCSQRKDEIADIDPEAMVAVGANGE